MGGQEWGQRDVLGDRDIARDRDISRDRDKVTSVANDDDGRLGAE
jgi:hypothetical protein